MPIIRYVIILPYGSINHNVRKVAMKTFVDNVCRQVIERHIVSDLPDLFSPMIVMELSDQDLVRIAAEPPQQKEERAALSELAQNLRDSLMHLHN